MLVLQADNLHYYIRYIRRGICLSYDNDRLYHHEWSFESKADIQLYDLYTNSYMRVCVCMCMYVYVFMHTSWRNC